MPDGKEWSKYGMLGGGLWDYPGATEARGRWAREQPAAAEQPFWKLKPQEMEELFYNLSTEPYPAPKGFSWKIVEYDPKTHQPIEPRWDLSEEVIEEDVTPPKSEVTTIGGWEMLGYYDKNGQFIVEQVLGKADDPMTGLTKALGEERRALVMKQQALLDRARQAEWAAGKKQTLAGLTSPADWIERRKAELAPPPKMERTFWASEEEASEAQEAWAAARPTGYLKAPDWLSQFVPSQTAGTRLTRGQIPTPSGQQWSQTPWSVREGLRGYTEWAGRRPYMDIMEHMEMMQPVEPLGGKYRRWSPASQRA